MSGGSIYDLNKVLSLADVKTTERYAPLSSDHLGATRPPQKSERGQDDDISISV